MTSRTLTLAAAFLLGLAAAAHAQPAIEVPPEEEPAKESAPKESTSKEALPKEGAPKEAAAKGGGATPQGAAKTDAQHTVNAPPFRPYGERTSLFGTIAQKIEAIINRTVIGGYGEFVFNVPEGRDSYFEARRLVLYLYSPIHPRISFATEIETEFGGTPRKVDGQLQAGEVILEFAVVDIKIADWLNLRGGVLLIPFNKFNVNHDAPTRDLTDRPLVVRTIIPSTWFETGAGLFGTLHPGPLDVNYEVYFINGLDSRIQDGFGNRPARGSLTQDNNNDKALVGRVGVGHFGRLGRIPFNIEFGVSGYTGAYDRRRHRANLVGGDLTLRLGHFEFLGEYVRAFNDPGFDDDYPTSSRQPVPTGMQGFYVQANYHFMPKFILRRLPETMQTATFTAVALYEEVDTDTVHDTSGDRTRLVFGLNFRPIEAVVWKNEVQFEYTGQVVDGKFVRRSFFGAGGAPRPAINYVTSVAFLF